jgi:hypothetical protein
MSSSKSLTDIAGLQGRSSRYALIGFECEIHYVDKKSEGSGQGFCNQLRELGSM